MKRTLYVLAVVIFSFLPYFQIFAQPTESLNFISETKKVNIPKKDVFGVDLGVGSIRTKTRVYDEFNTPFILKEISPVFAVGFRYLHHFNPYIGIDFIKINLNSPIRIQREMKLMNLQAMVGIRGNTPFFIKEMSGFAAVRMGYAIHFVDDLSHGFALETEIGLNFTRYFFIAFTYNLNSIFIDGTFNFYDPYSPPPYDRIYSTTLSENTFALRFGFNL